MTSHCWRLLLAFQMADDDRPIAAAAGAAMSFEELLELKLREQNVRPSTTA
jgi:hypothetical protein